MFNTLFKATLASVMICGTSASAQGKFLTAAEVKPILNATKASWIAVREYEGQDLLYFSHLLAWRCGLSGLLYSINDAEPMLNWALTPCNEESPTPAAILEDQAIYLAQPLNSIQTIPIQITYDDDPTDMVTYARKSVLTP